MYILLLQNDELTTDILDTLVRGFYPAASIFVSTSVAEAMRHWERTPCDLIICDVDLPDGNGLGFVRRVRAVNDRVRVLIVSARSDRATVMAAASCGIEGFFTKPLDVRMVHERLRKILPPPVEVAIQLDKPEKVVTDLLASLKKAVVSGVRLPTCIDPQTVNELMARSESLSVQELEAPWCDKPVLVGRLINASNSCAFRGPGDPIQSLRGALQVLGTRSSLDIALAVSLDITGTLKSEMLRSKAREYIELSGRVARIAVAMARMAHVDHGLCHSAGLLHRLGELAVIVTAQGCMDQGSEIDKNEFHSALESEWPARLAITVKSQWRLSLPLKQMIGAAYGFGLGSGPVACNVMRVAYLVVGGQVETEECRKILERLGISPDELPPEE